jgi:proteic killer suppression protein
MIRSFRDPESARLFQRERSRRLPLDIQRRALQKLRMLHAARWLEDLRLPPANQIETLYGDREGQHSLREKVSTASG